MKSILRSRFLFDLIRLAPRPLPRSEQMAQSVRRRRANAPIGDQRRHIFSRRDVEREVGYRRTRCRDLDTREASSVEASCHVAHFARISLFDRYIAYAVLDGPVDSGLRQCDITGNT